MQEAPLSPRQIEVLELLAKGLTNKEIAVVLGFTTDGTKAHLRAIFAKLGVADRTEAVVNAIQRRLASLGLNANPASRPTTTRTGM